MTPVDLTHVISPDMPVYPGTEPPVFTTGCSIDTTGFLEKKISLYSHTGTHIDAPAHMIKGHNTLDMLPVEHFYGPAFLIDIDHVAVKSIGIKQLEPHQGKIQAAEFLLIHTGWSRYWGSEKYFTGYPVLSLEAARWLSRFRLKGFGLDTISADTEDGSEYPIHKELLRNNIIIIENLANLAELPCRQFEFACFPLNFKDADGSPVRAVAFIA